MQNFSFDKNYGYIKEIKSGLNQYFEEDLPATASIAPRITTVVSQMPMKHTVTLSQYFERELLEETSASERNHRNDEVLIYDDSELQEHADDEDEEEIDIYTSYASYMSSSDPGSDNILVTIDYGSMDDDLSIDSLGIVEEEPEDDEEEHKQKMDYLQVPTMHTRTSKIKEEQSKESLHKSSDSLLRRVLNPFQVHRMQHSDTQSNSAKSSMYSLREYNVDTSGDYGSWQQQSESECGDRGTPREYRYEDLIKDEIINDDDVDYYEYGEDNRADDFADERRVEDDDDELVDFNYDVALSARWSSDNDKLYYRSVDYLN